MKKYIKSFEIKKNDTTILKMTSINMYLAEEIDTFEVTLGDCIVKCIEIESESDIYYKDDSPLGLVFLKQSTDYWFDSNCTVSEASEVFTKAFIKNNSSTTRKISGVFNSSNYVGNINLEVLGIYNDVIEVESFKIDYIEDFSYLLEDISNMFSELVSRSSSFFRNRFALSNESDERIYYSNFAFVKTILSPDKVPQWINYIISSPYSRLAEEKEKKFIWETDYIDMDDYIDGLLDNENMTLELSDSSNEVVIPITVNTTRQFDTIDVPENQFIKFFIYYLHEIIYTVLGYVNDEQKKLLFELKSAQEIIKVIMDYSFFKELSELKSIPYNSQVLHRKYPYNEIFKAYNDLMLTSKVSIDFFNDSFLAGQKDVAKLYEYWVFIKIFNHLNDKYNNNFKCSEWITYNQSTLNVNLSEENCKRVEYDVGNNIVLKLFYNKSYSNDVLAYVGRSYSREIKPDISLELFTNDILIGSIHFDAKYKVPENGVYRNDDIDRMHTYKDGIMGAIGAYAICLSKERKLFLQEKSTQTPMDELIFPSVGALPMNLNIRNENEEIENIITIIDKFVEIAFTQQDLGIFAKEKAVPYFALKRIIGRID